MTVVFSPCNVYRPLLCAFRLCVFPRLIPAPASPAAFTGFAIPSYDGRSTGLTLTSTFTGSMVAAALGTTESTESTGTGYASCFVTAFTRSMGSWSITR